MEDKKYLPLDKVTNLYQQFGLLSPEDKIIANKKTEEKWLSKRKNNMDESIKRLNDVTDNRDKMITLILNKVSHELTDKAYYKLEESLMNSSYKTLAGKMKNLFGEGWENTFNIK